MFVQLFNEIQVFNSIMVSFYFYFFVNRISDNSIVHTQFRGKISFLWAFYYGWGLSRSCQSCGLSHHYVNMQSWRQEIDVAYEGQIIIYIIEY